MPSHISHSLFAEEAISVVLGPEYHNRFRKPITFGAQGPDFFYHNRRTRPSCVMIGALIHKKDYARLMAAMAEKLIRNGKTLETAEAAYLLSFSTHAVLDRKLHPYINYRAGWGEAYRNCHPFLERILDVFLLKEKKGIAPNDTDFADTVNLGNDMPDWLGSLLSRSLLETYPILRDSENLDLRLQNAYTDAMGFYGWIDKITPDFFKMALQHEKEHKYSRRWLALIHPPSLPEDIDFMNRKNNEWCNPCDSGLTSSSSVYQLYNDALPIAISNLQTLQGVFIGKTPPRELSAFIGNENLSDEFDRFCSRKYSDPLPLQRVLDDLYRGIAS